MRKLIMVLLLLAISAAGWADEYVLVMSKEDNVCQPMLKIYNEDLRKYGEVRYDEHEEFKAIRWKGGTYIINNTERGKIYAQQGKYAKFDINNDGKNEMVFKDKTSLRNVEGDEIFVFADTNIDFSKGIEFSVDEVRKFSGIQIAPPWPYEIDLKMIDSKFRKKYYEGWTGLGISVMNPFFLNNTYYVGIEEVYKKPPIWHVISKYRDEQITVNDYRMTSKLEHVCYFEIITEHASQTKTQRRK